SRVGSPAFGVRAAEIAAPAAFDVLDHASATATTMRGAVDALVRYQRLLHDANDIRLEEMGHGEVRLSQRFRVAGPMPHHLCDFLVTILVQRAALISGGKFGVSRVELARPAPADISEHRRALEVPIAFGAERNALWFRREFLERPIPRADPSLCAVLR